MSKRLPVDDLGRVVLKNVMGEYLGMFQNMHCEEHGDVLHFTDQSGDDNCVVCIKGEVAEQL